MEKSTHIIHFHPKYTIVGGTVYIKELIHELKKNKIQSSMICGAVSKDQEPNLATDFRTIHFASKKPLELIISIISLVKLLIRARSSANVVAHCHGRNTLIPAIISFFLRVPIVYQAHGYHYFNKKYNLVINRELNKLIDFLFLKLSKSIIFTCTSEYNNYVNKWLTIDQSKCVIIPTRINIEKNEKNLKYQFNAGRTFRIACISASNFHQKGVDRLISLIRSLKNINFDFKVFHYFKVKDELELQILNRLISEAEVEDRYIMRSPVNDVWLKIMDCDALISTSRYEGRNIAIQEAFVKRMPVIATNCSGQDELLSDDRSVVLPDNNEDLWPEIILSFFNNYKNLGYEKSNHASKFIRNDGGIDLMAKEFAALYRKLHS